SICRRLGVEPALGVKVKRKGLSVPRRPSGILPPMVGSRLEYPGLGMPERSLVLEMEFEERQLDLFAVEVGGLGVERNMAQGSAVAAGADPAAVVPGAHDQEVGRVRTGGFDALKCFQGAEQIVSIEPTADGQDGRLDIPLVWPEVARLPERIIGAVLHQLVPE